MGQAHVGQLSGQGVDGRWAHGASVGPRAAGQCGPDRAGDTSSGNVEVVLGVLFLLFLVVPFVELFVIIQVGQAIGALDTVALLVVVSAVGAWLVKREGLGVLRRARQRVDAGAVPGRELVDGVLILFAGALLLTPGFLTDLVGVLLLVPPVRASVRLAASRFLQRRMSAGTHRRW